MLAGEAPVEGRGDLVVAALELVEGASEGGGVREVVGIEQLALLEQAPKALEGVVRALEMSRAAAQGQEGSLSVSFLPSARPLVLAAVRRYHARFAAVHLSLEEGLDEFQYDGLETGRFDLAVVRGYRPLPQLVLENLVDSRLCVALPVTHGLADANELGYEDLADEDFVLWPRVGSPDGYDRIIAGCRRTGYEPRLLGRRASQLVAAMARAMKASDQAARVQGRNWSVTPGRWGHVRELRRAGCTEE